MSSIIEFRKVTPEQVEYVTREYALAKKLEADAVTPSEKELALVVCAKIEQIAHFLGISPLCLSKSIGKPTTIH